MKLAVAIASSEAPSSAFVVWRGFEESIKKAAKLGYDGVELALKDASEIDFEKISKCLKENNMEVSCISTGQVFAVSNLYFTNPDKSKRDEAIKVFSDFATLAEKFGCLLNVGRTRGFIAENQTKEEAENLFIDTARKICDDAAQKNVEIIIEPVNRYEINFVNTVAEGAELLAKVERANLGLMPDVFHMNIEDAQIGETFAEYANLVRYVHFASSHRLAPGQGHLDWDDIFNGLKKAKFNGWASIEIFPKPDSDTAAKQAVEFIMPKIKEFNK